MEAQCYYLQKSTHSHLLTTVPTNIKQILFIASLISQNFISSEVYYLPKHSLVYIQYPNANYKIYLDILQILLLALTTNKLLSLLKLPIMQISRKCIDESIWLILSKHVILSIRHIDSFIFVSISINSISS